MLAHGIRSAFPIPGLNTRINMAMIRQGLLHAIRFLAEFSEPVLEVIPHRLEHLQQYVVMCCLRDRQVEFGIQNQALLCIGRLPFHFIENSGYPTQVIFCSSFRGHLGHLSLEQCSRLYDFYHGVAVEQHSQGFGRQQVFGLRLAHESAPAWPDLNHVHCRQTAQRLAYRRTSYLQALHQIAFRWQTVARFQVSISNEGQELLHDRINQGDFLSGLYLHQRFPSRATPGMTAILV